MLWKCFQNFLLPFLSRVMVVEKLPPFQGSGRIVLHVNNFTLAEVEQIQKMLASKFNIESYNLRQKIQTHKEVM
jgi:hypothetical protein